MKVALIGASGFIGGAVRAEALGRGHEVTAIVRDATKLSDAPGLRVAPADVTDVAKVAAILRGHDLVISAFNTGGDTGPVGSKSIVEAVRQSGVGRMLMVGGAGSLLLEDGRRYADTEHFPSAWREGALKLAGILDWLRASVSDIDWVYISPADVIAPGERTGKFRLGHDHLLRDEAGKSLISVEDYAVALLDEAETPAHHRERFTIAY